MNRLALATDRRGRRYLTLLEQSHAHTPKAVYAKRRKALRKARVLIKRGRNCFICHALEDISYDASYDDNPDLALAARMCIQHIGWLLGGPNVPVERWLRKQGVTVKNRDTNGYPITKEAREYRLRWIDHMLATDPFFIGESDD